MLLLQRRTAFQLRSQGAIIARGFSLNCVFSAAVHSWHRVRVMTPRAAAETAAELRRPLEAALKLALGHCLFRCPVHAAWSHGSSGHSYRADWRRESQSDWAVVDVRVQLQVAQVFSVCVSAAVAVPAEVPLSVRLPTALPLPPLSQSSSSGTGNHRPQSDCTIANCTCRSLGTHCCISLHLHFLCYSSCSFSSVCLSDWTFRLSSLLPSRRQAALPALLALLL